MRVSIVGITGYSGLELLKILSNHPFVEVTSIYATKAINEKISDLFPFLSKVSDLVIKELDIEDIIQTSDLVFFATPSGIAKKYSEFFITKNFPVIDLSGDHRLSKESYEKWYQKDAISQEFLDEFLYSLADLDEVKGNSFISNPGCYATATELALIPLVAADVIELDSIIVDAKSGLSGAGKNPSPSSHFVSVNGNYTTYKVNSHQHIPEIMKVLTAYNPQIKSIQFSTSLLPINRGLVSTSYVRLKEGFTLADIDACYKKMYGDKIFIRLCQTLPDLHHVIGSNFVDIGYVYNEVTGILTIVSVIDNLIKGAAGQAVQNFNKMFGYSEETGLMMEPLYI